MVLFYILSPTAHKTLLIESVKDTVIYQQVYDDQSLMKEMFLHPIRNVSVAHFCVFGLKRI